MKKLNPKGFTVVEGLLILLIVGILGGVGWFVWHSNNTTKTVDNNASQSSPEVTTPVKKTVDNTKYLTIKEWGVKIPLSTGIEDAYYVNLKTGVPDVLTVSLGSQALTAKSAVCGPEDGQVGLAHIFRQTVADHDKNQSEDNPADVGTIKLGDYYFGFAQAQAGCGETSQTELLNQQQADIKLFRTAFEHLTAVN